MLLILLLLLLLMLLLLLALLLLLFLPWRWVYKFGGGSTRGVESLDIAQSGLLRLNLFGKKKIF